MNLFLSQRRSSSALYRRAWLYIVSGLFFSSCVEGTIQVIDSGEIFESRPDRKVGQRLWKGYEYMGRMQIIPQNPTLCPLDGNDLQKKHKIVKPADGVPVGLVVASGGCSVTAKALVASTMIDPPNQVQYIIVQDRSRRGRRLGSDFGGTEGESDEEKTDNGFDIILHDNNLSLEDEASVINLHKLDLLSRGDESFFDGENSEMDVADDESFMGAAYVTNSDNKDNSTSLTENFNDGDRIRVAVLHVSTKVGAQLFDVIAKETTEVHQAGGVKVLLNGKQPAMNARMIVMWMLTTLVMCACACCCMLMFVQSGLEDEQQQAPTRPVRRRLTLEQVRTRFPAFHFDPEEHQQQQMDPDSESMQYCQLLDECTICLDEFHAGVRCRELPCQHVFHSTCIARWLIERSAVCPLCKLDLYEEEDNESSDVAADDAEQMRSTQSLLRWWSELTRTNRDERTNEAAGSQVEIPGTDTVTSRNDNAAPPGVTNELEETRSWWPFSVESSIDEPNRRWRFSSGLNWFGHRRQPRHSRPADTDLFTELTEPLVAASSRAEAEQTQQDSSLEEVSFVPSADQIVEARETTAAEI